MEEWDMLGGDVLFISSQDFTMELAWDELDKEKRMRFLFYLFIPSQVHHIYHCLAITVYPRDTTDEHIEVLCNADFNPPIRLVRYFQCQRNNFCLILQFRGSADKNIDAYLGLVLDANS